MIQSLKHRSASLSAAVEKAGIKQGPSWAELKRQRDEAIELLREYLGTSVPYRTQAEVDERTRAFLASMKEE